MIRRFRWKGTAWRSGLAAGLAAAAMTVATITGVVQTAGAAAGGSTLSAGQVLQAGQALVSPGGQYTLIMQDDGNLVTYGNGCVIWASNTAGVGSSDYLVMQGDGNLVIYTNAGKPVWASNTAGTGSGNSLNMQVDGNLVVYTSGAKPVWASGAGNADQLCAPHSMGLDQYIHSSGGQYRLLMQDDGNLVLYGPNGATWASNTVGSGGTSVNMQGDGNLVIYTSAAKPVWASNTAGTGSGNHLVMQDDGNLVIYTSGGKPVWATNTVQTSPSSSGQRAVAWEQAHASSQNWNNLCETAVEHAYGVYGVGNGGFYTAMDNYKAQRAAGRIHTDRNAPTGALVFFSGNSSSGHVGLAAGDGKNYYTTDGGTIHLAPLSEGGTYYGWSYAPSSWPGV